MQDQQEVAVLLALASGLASADGGKGVVVQPLTPKAGDVISVKSDLLGPNSEVEVRVIGARFRPYHLWLPASKQRSLACRQLIRVCDT